MKPRLDMTVTTAAFPSRRPFSFMVMAEQGNDLVAVHLVTLFVAAKAAVGITVKGNAAVKAAFHHGLFQIFQMGAAHAPR